MIILILLILLAPLMCSCVALIAGAARGVGTSVWLSNKLVQEVNVSFEDTITPSRPALRSFGFDIEKETRKDDIAQFISKYTNRKTI